MQNLSYTYDLLGNPLSRTDANTSLSRDASPTTALNRLTSATVNLSPTPLVEDLRLQRDRQPAVEVGCRHLQLSGGRLARCRMR